MPTFSKISPGIQPFGHTIYCCMFDIRISVLSAKGAQYHVPFSGVGGGGCRPVSPGLDDASMLPLGTKSETKRCYTVRQKRGTHVTALTIRRTAITDCTRDRVTIAAYPPKSEGSPSEK